MSGFFSLGNFTKRREDRLKGRTVFKAALKHTMANKKIFTVPLLSSAISLGIVILFISPIFNAISGGFDASYFLNGLGLFLFLFVVALLILTTVSEATVLIMANQILAGEVASISAALATALKHLPKLLVFALWNLTVGSLIRVFQNSFVGSFIADLFAFIGGLAWTAATYFTLPGVLFENLGPVEATKRGVQALKDKWGDAVGPAVVVSFVVFLCYFAGIGLLVGPIWLAMQFGSSFNSTSSIAYAIYSSVSLGLGLIAMAWMIQSSTMALVKVAIYRYVKGQSVAGLDDETMHGAMSARTRFLVRRRLNGTV